MSKLTIEDKIEIYKDRQKGMSFSELCKKYSVVKSYLQYYLRLVDKHGIDILNHAKNRYYEDYEIEEMINRVLINKETVMAVALENGLLSASILREWIKKYKENGYNIVERKRGRPIMGKKKEKQTVSKETLEEENKRLKEENLYLKAEIEYSKKLRAVVQARKNQQQKKK